LCFQGRAAALSQNLYFDFERAYTSQVTIAKNRSFLWFLNPELWVSDFWYF